MRILVNGRMEIICFWGLVAVLGFLFVIMGETIESQRSDLNFFRQTYKYKSGGTMQYNSYQIATFDGGEIWYAVKRERDGGVNIIGRAEAVYPGLLKQLEAMDKLVEQARINGSINPEGASPEQIQLLKDAGFIVQIKPISSAKPLPEQFAELKGFGDTSE